MRHGRLVTSSAIGLVLIAGSAFAQSSTETYTYDALGRLVTAKTTGGQNNNETHSLCYDPSGNRTQYKATSDGTAASCSPTPTPTPTPTPGPSFSIGNAAGLEGDILTFTVTKSGATSSTHTVNYATATGTAGTGDYYTTSGTLSFAAAETTKSVYVTTKADFLTESDEVFYVNLSGASGGATISDAQGNGTIIDDSSGGCPLC